MDRTIFILLIVGLFSASICHAEPTPKAKSPLQLQVISTQNARMDTSVELQLHLQHQLPLPVKVQVRIETSGGAQLQQSPLIYELTLDSLEYHWLHTLLLSDNFNQGINVHIHAVDAPQYATAAHLQFFSRQPGNKVQSRKTQRYGRDLLEYRLP